MFVFLSHASADKPALKPIVDALIARDIKVWIDKPYKLGYSKEKIDSCFRDLRLRANERWEDTIDEAKRRSSCILALWSKRTARPDALSRHRVLFEEVNYGRTERKLVNCRIDDVRPKDLPGSNATWEMPDIRDRTALQLVIDDVLRTMDQTAEARVGDRINRRQHRSPLLPYLVNREPQEEVVETELMAVPQSGSVWPAFIVGPENECLDEFLERLEKHTSPRCLRNGQCWETLKVVWQPDDPLESFSEKFAQRLARQLAGAGSRRISDPIRSLNERGRPLAVISRVLACDWRVNEEDFVQAWLRFWQNAAPHITNCAVFPILAIKLPPAKPGWRDIPAGGWFDGVGQKNRLICNTLKRLSDEFAGMKISRPPILHPISKSAADYWRIEHFSLSDEFWINLEDEIKTFFRQVLHKKHGAPHFDFAKAVTPIIRGAV